MGHVSLRLAGWAHVVCALYIPEVEFANVSTMEPIVLQSVPHERYNKVFGRAEQTEHLPLLSETRWTVERTLIGGALLAVFRILIWSQQAMGWGAVGGHRSSHKARQSLPMLILVSSPSLILLDRMLCSPCNYWQL